VKTNGLITRAISLLLTVTMALSATSCGTLFYPERRGQDGGRIDGTIVLLDGIGLLFFLLPGIIAFAVDFSTGAIYLPSDAAQLDPDPSDLHGLRIVQADPASLSRHEVEELLRREVGREIDLGSPQTKVTRVLPGQRPVWGTFADILTPDELAAFEGYARNAAR